MKDFPFSSAVFSVFVHATEDKEKVLKAAKFLLPGGEFVAEDVTGHYGNPITLLGSKINKKAVLEGWWTEAIKKMGPGDVEKLKKALPGKIDESCRLYLRFDKQRAYLEELALAEGEGTIYVKLKVAVWPAKKESAVEALGKIL